MSELTTTFRSTPPAISGISIPIRGATSALPNARLVARLLASDSLVEALSAGNARSLSQALEQLNPPERETLRSRWGRSLDELVSLSNERDARVFNQGLLQVAQRLEANDQLELAGVVYSALVGGATPHPALRPASVSARAQRRLNAMNGTGDWRERLAFSLERIPGAASRWDMVLAMTGAGLTFRGLRLLTTARWAGSFESALALNAAATSTAFLGETLAFTGLHKLAGAVAGHPQDFTPEGIFNEWASGAAMLLGLKGMGALTGAGVRSIYGESAASTALGRFTQAAAPQLGMFMGILVGNRLAEAGGFHPERRGDTWLTDAFTTLLEFNVAGRLQRAAGGPGLANLEGRMEALTRSLGTGSLRPGCSLGPELVTPEGIRIPMIEDPAIEGKNSNAVFSLSLNDSGVRSISSGSLDPLLEMPRMGVKEPGSRPSARDRVVRENAERALRSLMPQGQIQVDRLADPTYVSAVLKSFGVTQHEFDQAAFRRGFELGRENPELVRRLGFDVDEVYLHWSLNAPDLFRGFGRGGVDALYHNTAPDLLQYQPFEVGPGVKLNFFQRLWFNGLQELFPMRMRQNIQFHPGVRAYQLGLRFGLGEDLTMVTTGPAGRILVIANEDPAMRMIYFGKTPGDSVNIEEVRNGANIYTREHLVLAMRKALSGDIPPEAGESVASYLERIRANPKKGEKLKHPAVAPLLGKRPFDILVDDSSSTFKMLGNLPGFTVLQPPSARPGLLLNFVFGSPQRYLDRMGNGYVEDLATLLSQSEISSTVLSKDSTAPADYPYQRFSIEIPWSRFMHEFVLPARELRHLSAKFRDPRP